MDSDEMYAWERKFYLNVNFKFTKFLFVSKFFLSLAMWFIILWIIKICVRSIDVVYIALPLLGTPIGQYGTTFTPEIASILSIHKKMPLEKCRVPSIHCCKPFLALLIFSAPIRQFIQRKNILLVDMHFNWPIPYLILSICLLKGFPCLELLVSWCNTTCILLLSLALSLIKSIPTSRRKSVAISVVFFIALSLYIIDVKHTLGHLDQNTLGCFSHP